MSNNVWPAPAKLNLFLHIIGRRKDGYHQLQTVFQILDYADEIEFQPTDDSKIYVKGNYVEIAKDDDLVFRAASSLRQITGVNEGIDISVNKRIPLGGGLGGGSSDAATTLVALNEIWDIGLSLPDLADIGFNLGADVPVFIHGHSAWGEGIGEKLEPVTLGKTCYLVVHPGCHVNTARIFSSPDLTRNSSPITIRDFEEGTCRNDCESVVFHEFPEIADAALWLGRWSEARLTGTGACLFSGFTSEQEAGQVYDQLPSKWQGFICKGMNRSPLLMHLDKVKQEKSEIGV